MKPKSNPKILFNRNVADLKPLDRTWHQIEVTGQHDTVYNKERIVQVIDREGLEMMVDDFETLASRGNFPGLLVNEDHLPHLGPQYSSQAFGWLKDLEIRNGQLWGEIEWSDIGAEAVRNHRFQYFSTEYPAEGLVELSQGRIRPTMLSGLALTNLPNNKGGLPISNRRDSAGLENPTHKPTNEPTMKNIAKKLGLSDEATEEQILNRVGELQAENADIKKKADEAEADAVLNRLGNRIPEAARGHWRSQLITNREATEKLIEVSFPEKAAEKAEPKKPLTNRATAGTPGVERATGSEDEGAADEVLAARIANRARTLKESGLSMFSAYSTATAQIAEEDKLAQANG